MFDAVLEETVNAEAQLTGYTAESGVSVVDHRVLSPIKWTMTGGLSNNPLRISATDFTGLLSDIVENSIGDLIGNGAAQLGLGLAAGLLSGPAETRTSEAMYSLLLDLWASGEEFDVVTGDITLVNMSVVKVSRTNDIDNEGALIFQVELQELPRLGRIQQQGGTGIKRPTTDMSEPSATSIGDRVNRGLVSLREVGETINEEVNDVLGIFL
ncbi:phage baseplate protein [Sessilibacter corallicola]|uniref:phage baseplate protein n=1 Tax=Sessilibacter corallicola TaxID=2904075 RepID=UPI001E5E16DE|nr:hypothetical protein [Sessilibacter corallicola]MCE2029297.1 hypothetical protein [Sessilibacter corallicola]